MHALGWAGTGWLEAVLHGPGPETILAAAVTPLQLGESSVARAEPQHVVHLQAGHFSQIQVIASSSQPVLHAGGQRCREMSLHSASSWCSTGSRALETTQVLQGSPKALEEGQKPEWP